MSSDKTHLAPVAQGIEHSFPKAGVAGSNPAGGVWFVAGAAVGSHERGRVGDHRTKLPTEPGGSLRE